MFGFKLVKTDPNMFVLHYRGGKVRRSGPGLSFVYFSPTSSIVAVPLAGEHMPYMFSEVTADFQEVTVQGQVTYRIQDPERIASMLNSTPASRDLASTGGDGA